MKTRSYIIIGIILFSVVVNEAYAKCMIDDDECYGFPMLPPLKLQLQYFALPDITCPNQDHVLAERPNGKLACVTDNMAEKTGWHVHYKNTVDFKGEVMVSPGAVSWISFEITGATLDKMIYEEQMLVASVTPNDEHGVLSLELSSGELPANFEYCNPDNENQFDTPFVMIIDGQKYPLDEGVNSRGQAAVNIPLDENSDKIEIVRTCNEPSKKPSIGSDSKKMEDVQDLENMRKSILELDFNDDIITVLISDETYFGAMTSFEFTTIPVSSLVQAHDMLPETSMNDRIMAGSILSEIVKSGTYITQNGDKEFWYTIGGIESQVITIELQNHEYDRITFVSENNKKWIDQINDIVLGDSSNNSKNPDSCPQSFSSRCFTGKVTEIFNGDTVRVDHALFRLALVSSPELDEEKGQEAKSFLEQICTIGSDALVDQDDLRPLEGLSGSSRILGVVYCDGLNLNEKLVEFDSEYFEGMYCHTSEFANDPWAREGCSEYGLNKK